MRYKVISFGGQFNEVPPVPNLTDIIPSFFNALTIFRIVAGLIPVDNYETKVVTMCVAPYAKIKISQ